MAILNYTTSVAVERSCQEIYAILAKHKASAIMSEYDDKGIISAISFRLNTPQGVIHYTLPANVRGVSLRLKEAKRAIKSPEQAARVAWRILKDWIEAQMAIVEAGMAEVPQIFLPYARTATGQTVYERFKTGGVGTIGLTYDDGKGNS